jgi:hypothetical protein
VQRSFARTISVAAALDRHHVAHAALTAVYVATGVILALGHEHAHAICALVAAVIYATLMRGD